MPRFAISQITTLPASFEEDLRVYRSVGAEGIGIWEIKLREGEEPAQRAALRESGLASTCAIPAVPSIAPLPIPGPDAQNLGQRRLPPLTDGHLFGTDQLGRDLLSRVLHGGQVSLSIGVLAVLVSGVIGVLAGSAAGYFGGWVDAVVSRLLEAQLSLPLLMMLLLVVALFGPSVPVITFVIAIAQWPEVARLTRSLVLVEREKPYVAAARVLGLKPTTLEARMKKLGIRRPAQAQ